MSSFWNLFGKQSADGSGEPVPEIEPADAPGTPSENAAAAEAEPLALTSLKPPLKGSAEPKALLLPKQSYGIDDAIKLMRTLPVDDNVDLVVRVIKRTLESLSVRVPDIIDDATRRQDALKNGITERQSAIQQLEREIETRRVEIAHLEEELAETSTVRERLQLAESLQASVPPQRLGVTPIAPGTAPAASRRPDAPPPPRTSAAPPLPTTTFRPKLGSSDFKKAGAPSPDPPPAAFPTPAAPAAVSAPPAAVAAPPPPPSPSPSATDEVAVESSDLVEKSP